MQTLLRFLQNGKTQFHVAALAKEFLDAHNFTQVSDRENLAELAAGRYYLAPFWAIVIPFVKGGRATPGRLGWGGAGGATRGRRESHLQE